MTTPAARSTSSLPAASRTQTLRRPPPPCRHRLDRHPQPAPTPPQVEAPALVRYPIGTHHAAMTQPFEGRTEILTWWGLMQATSATESAQHVALCPRLLVPRQREASWIDGPRRGWAISKDGLETRIERWAPHAEKARLPTPKAGCDLAGQHLPVCPGAFVPETYQGDLPAARVAVGGAARGGCHGGRGVGSIGGGRLDLLCARGLAGPPQPPPINSPRLWGRLFIRLP